MLEMLAQADWNAPLTKYFSYIALGLMVCIGYVILRVLTSRKKKEEERDRREKNLEAYFAEAEQEARRRRQEKELAERGEAPDALEDDELAPSPSQQAEQERLKRLVQHSEGPDNSPGETSAADESQSERENPR